MYLLELILSGEVEDYSAGIALDRARSGLLEVNLSAEVGRAQQIFAGHKEKLSAVRPSAHLGRCLLIILFLRGIVLVCTGFTSCLGMSGSGFHADITGCDDIFHVVLRAKVKGRLIGLHIAGLAGETRLVEDDLSRLVGDDPVFRLDDSSMRPRNFEMNLRRERQL